MSSPQKNSYGHMSTPAVSIERIHHIDPETGCKITQLTSYPTPHMHQYIYGQCISGDDSLITLLVQRAAAYGAPSDMYSVRSDGSEFTRLAEDCGWSALSRDGKWVYVGRGSEVCRIAMADGAEETIAEVPRVKGISVMSVSRDGSRIIATGSSEGQNAIVVLGSEGQDARVIYRTPGGIMHLQSDGSDESRLLMSLGAKSDYGVWAISIDGEELGPMKFAKGTNHYVWLGSTGRAVTTRQPDDQGLEIASPGDEPDVLPLDHSAWHPTSDDKGKWVVVDTNWPKEGLFLVNSENGKMTKICDTGASCGHPQWTHAHPRLNHAGDWVLFDSDRTGIVQVYLAHITDEMRSAVSD